MKKLISALCTISILLSTAFSSFAAVKITNVFVDGDGSYWYFGSFDSETDTDVGLEVGHVLRDLILTGSHLCKYTYNVFYGRNL